MAAILPSRVRGSDGLRGPGAPACDDPIVPSPRTAEGPQTKRRLIATITGSVVVVDAATKAVASRALAGHGVVDVLGGVFHLELYRNFAGPGNLLAGHPVLVSVLSLIAVALIAGYAWGIRTTSYAVAVALLLGGGVGNLLDRLLRAPGPLRGGVIDWIKPTLSSGNLNVADLSINAGVLAMVIALALEAYRRPRAGAGAGLDLG
jgi:signal peptidase II